MTPTKLHVEYALLGLLALLWGSSYLFIKVAVAEIPPITLIALRVSGAAAFLGVVLWHQGARLPNDRRTWAMLALQSLFNSTLAWTVLAWGQQHVSAGLAAVLNSTSPLFVLFITLGLSGRAAVRVHQIAGAVIGLAGVVLIIGPDVLAGLGTQILGQLACLAGAALYACAALFGRNFGHLPPVVTATGTMICASLVLVPAALILDHPWTLTPSFNALAATAVLSVFGTGVALLIYFRLLSSLGALAVASQAYLRAGVGLILGVAILGEAVTGPQLGGIAAALVGVALINRRAGRGAASLKP